MQASKKRISISRLCHRQSLPRDNSDMQVMDSYLRYWISLVSTGIKTVSVKYVTLQWPKRGNLIPAAPRGPS